MRWNEKNVGGYVGVASMVGLVISFGFWNFLQSLNQAIYGVFPILFMSMVGFISLLALAMFTVSYKNLAQEKERHKELMRGELPELVDIAHILASLFVAFTYGICSGIILWYVVQTIQESPPLAVMGLVTLSTYVLRTAGMAKITYESFKLCNPADYTTPQWFHMIEIATWAASVVYAIWVNIHVHLN